MEFKSKKKFIYQKGFDLDFDKCVINKEIEEIIPKPKPQSIIYPNTTGDKALANTTIAWKSALTVPILSRPNSSAHNEPVKGDEIPKLKPYNDI